MTVADGDEAVYSDMTRGTITVFGNSQVVPSCGTTFLKGRI